MNKIRLPNKFQFVKLTGGIKVILFRQLWIWLAEGQKQLGLAHINDEMIEELKDKKETIDWDNLRETEKILKHDVMSHIEIYKKVMNKISREFLTLENTI